MMSWRLGQWWLENLMDLASCVLVPIINLQISSSSPSKMVFLMADKWGGDPNYWSSLRWSSSKYGSKKKGQTDPSFWITSVRHTENATSLEIIWHGTLDKSLLAFSRGPTPSKQCNFIEVATIWMRWSRRTCGSYNWPSMRPTNSWSTIGTMTLHGTMDWGSHLGSWGIRCIFCS